MLEIRGLPKMLIDKELNVGIHDTNQARISPSLNDQKAACKTFSDASGQLVTFKTGFYDEVFVDRDYGIISLKLSNYDSR